MEFKYLDPNVLSQLRQDYNENVQNEIQIGKEEWFLPRIYLKLADRIRSFEVRSDDIWILGFPRSGTTLTQEICWLLSHDLDFAEATNTPMNVRIRFFDVPILSGDDGIKLIDHFYDSIKNMKGRRIIKSHLPYCLLPTNLLTSGCKVVCTARNPKDVAVSYYNFFKILKGHQFLGDFEKFWNYFQNGHVAFGPYWNYIGQSWELKDHKNVLFTFYEDFLTDPKNFISSIAKFLQYDLNLDQINAIENYMNFNNLKKSQSVNVSLRQAERFIKDDKNQFLRNGKIGDWKNYFSDELNERADQWITVNIHSLENFTFPNIE